MLERSAFLSYVHADDKHEHGRIIQLARDLEGEFEMQTAEKLRVRFDREILTWGNRWRPKLEEAIRDATFMICVVTPRFFRSTECRNEVERFSTVASALGRDDLLLPLLYVEVPDLDTNTADDLKVLIAAAQYEDWTQLRLEDRPSSTYRRGLHGLAKALRKRIDELDSPTEPPAQQTRTGSVADLEHLGALLRRTVDIRRAMAEQGSAVVVNAPDRRQAEADFAHVVSERVSELEEVVRDYRATVDLVDDYAHNLLEGNLDITNLERIEAAEAMVAFYPQLVELEESTRHFIDELSKRAREFVTLRPALGRFTTVLELFADCIPTQYGWSDDAAALLEQIA